MPGEFGGEVHRGRHGEFSDDPDVGVLPKAPGHVRREPREGAVVDPPVIANGMIYIVTADSKVFVARLPT
ncbi:hypothetical protein EDD99_5362 [Streptomyces sp. 846.5]|nr:hypothetical protein EDD99_8089 [Streptomyces sp. 846.5]TDT97252.1 hypothetical protein EDD99_5362 [Streptomyces sp. 846.5]